MESDLSLSDIHLPSPIGWWPPAPGWWLLVFGIPALLVLLVYLWRFLRRTTTRKLALRELEAIALSPSKPQEKVQQLAILLRRTALSVYPRTEVAGLIGMEWLAFLDQALDGRRFSEGPGRLLIEAPYRREFQGELDALILLCRDWIKHLPKSRKATRKSIIAKT